MIRVVIFFAIIFPVTLAAQVSETNILATVSSVDYLANVYAPQIMYQRDEPNLPANVDWFLPKTALSFVNQDCVQDNKQFGMASASSLQDAQVVSKCGGPIFRASGTRSASRRKTFVLADVSDSYKGGIADPAQWNTYYHAYRNSVGGWTIQFWSFYAFNTGTKIFGIEVGYHGGDWEMASVVLGPDNQPRSLDTTGHTAMASTPWSMVQTTGTHPIVYAEKGGHEVHVSVIGSAPYVVHQTWSDPTQSAPSSKLINLGSKLHPNVSFLSYSGLWGSLGATPISSGYWGPAFNETAMRSDGFITAWCSGIANPNENEGPRRECYPDDSQ